MKKKNLVLVFTLILTVALSTAAFAVTYANPGEILSGLTGKSQAEITTERSEGKTYGQIAQDNGKLDAFRDEMLEYKKSVIDERVKSGIISQENGEILKKSIEERVAACPGTPGVNQERLGQKLGGRMGCANGLAQGGLGRGMGQGQMGQGMGFGRMLSR